MTCANKKKQTRKNWIRIKADIDKKVTDHQVAWFGKSKHPPRYNASFVRAINKRLNNRKTKQAGVLIPDPACLFMERRMLDEDNMAVDRLDQDQIPRS